jgi:serine/threonine protein kinase
MENDSRSINSLTKHSITTLKSNEQGKRRDTIPYRIQFVQELMRDKSLRPLIDFTQVDTEYYKNGTEMSNETEFGDTDSNDTRRTLHKRVLDFYNIITQIGGDLHYIKSGTTGHTFKGVIDCGNGDIFNYGLKVVAFPKKDKYGIIYDSTRPENAEIRMLRLFGYFIATKQTPHIVLPIATFNTSISPFLTLLEDEVVDETDEKYVEFLKKYKEGEYYDEVSILLSEWANRGDLLDYIKKNYENIQLIHWKVFFFQLISTLAVIQSKFPDFRHNDLKANNILIHKISRDKPRFTYTILRKKYSIPNIGYSIKLWDFDFANIPGIVDNAKVSLDWTKPINVTPAKHQYYDIHYFFNTLAFTGFFPKFMTSEHIHKDVKEFVKRIIPAKYRSKLCIHKSTQSQSNPPGTKKQKEEQCKICHKYVHSKGRLLASDEYITPAALLSDPFFAEFIPK